MARINAILIDKNYDAISGDYAVNVDGDFDNIEITARKNGMPCAIKWSRASDGQAAYWTPSGADSKPYWYNGTDNA
mgnify:CR=1 FL=1